MKRSTGDVLVLMIAGTICLVILLSVVGIALIEIIDPDVNTERVSAQIGDVINTLIGVLAGYLAGRTRSRTRDDEQDNE